MLLTGGPLWWFFLCDWQDRQKKYLQYIAAYRRHCISVSHDQRRKPSYVSDVHIIVKSEVMDGLRLESGQRHSRWVCGCCIGCGDILKDSKYNWISIHKTGRSFSQERKQTFFLEIQPCYSEYHPEPVKKIGLALLLSGHPILERVFCMCSCTCVAQLVETQWRPESQRLNLIRRGTRTNSWLAPG